MEHHILSSKIALKDWLLYCQGKVHWEKINTPEERWVCIAHLHQPLSNLINHCPCFWSDPKLWNSIDHCWVFSFQKDKENYCWRKNSYTNYNQLWEKGSRSLSCAGSKLDLYCSSSASHRFLFWGEGKAVGREGLFLLHLLSQEKTAMALWNHFLCLREPRDHGKLLAAFCRSACQTIIL